MLAVVLGAVRHGVERAIREPVATRTLQHHYGVSTSQPFSAVIHSNEDLYTDPMDGKRKAKGQITWLLRRGDPIPENQIRQASLNICRRFREDDPRIFNIEVVMLGADDAPQRMAEIQGK
jgi:hypothetical protein